MDRSPSSIERRRQVGSRPRGTPDLPLFPQSESLVIGASSSSRTAWVNVLGILSLDLLPILPPIIS
jgi:hypothetical protein